MNSKLWIRKIVVMLLITSFSLLMTACPKANETIRDFKNNSAKLKIYARNIQKANNASFDAGDLSKDQLRVLTAASAKFRDAIKALDAGIVQAEFILRDNPDGKRTVVDMLDRILDQQVVAAFDGLVNAITGHPVVTDNVRQWIEAIRIALAALRAVLASVQNANGGLNVA
jgi:hypothetical protein